VNVLLHGASEAPDFSQDLVTGGRRAETREDTRGVCLYRGKGGHKL
jgi:hypothetical protein